jgi:hypothetical protein
MGERREVFRVLVGKPGVRDNFGDPGVDGRIILRWIFQEVGCVGMDWIELPQGHLAGTCECGDEPSGSIKCGEFFD